MKLSEFRKNIFQRFAVRDGGLMEPVGGRFVGRVRTRDAAYGFRMPAGIVGDLSRMVPAPKVLPRSLDATNPPLLYGVPVVAVSSTNGVRQVLTSDGTSTIIYGVMVRPFPINQPTTSNNFGAVGFGPGAVPAPPAIVDVLVSGGIMVLLSGSAAATMGAPVYVWYGAASGTHIVGGWEAGSGTTIALPAQTCTWGGPADGNGIAELLFNM